ncbi:unnamed protein product [Chondrus crispus]|uniref:Uncharacterized protein n=1 Tax=Chondrus crispus TaxID=2769 RepID=R7Q962_CHOCR|nr:unnamed protein product [Chondrus crispus]CDF35062.1 unnamed protein product [Chondrus crispus]|eukprot:XP_005714881.1 unnamed protein product [Chondrus crispus]
MTVGRRWGRLDEEPESPVRRSKRLRRGLASETRTVADCGLPSVARKRKRSNRGSHGISSHEPESREGDGSALDLSAAIPTRLDSEIGPLATNVALHLNFTVPKLSRATDVLPPDRSSSPPAVVAGASTGDTAAGADAAVLQRQIASLLNRERARADEQHIYMQTMQEVKKLQGEKINSLMIEVARLNAQVMELSHAKAALEVLVAGSSRGGRQAAAAAERAVIATKKKRQKDEAFLDTITPLQRDLVVVMKYASDDIARRCMRNLTPMEQSPGIADYRWVPSPLKIAEGDGIGPLGGGTRAAVPPLDVAKLGITNGALLPPQLSPTILARTAYKMALESGSLISALRAASKEEISGACIFNGIQGASKLSAEVADKASSYMSSLKRTVWTRVAKVWDVSCIRVENKLKSASVDYIIHALNNAAGEDVKMMGIAFADDDSGGIDKIMRACIDCITSGSLDHWRTVVPPGHSESDNIGESGVDILFVFDTARDIYKEWAGLRLGKDRLRAGVASILTLARLDAWIATRCVMQVALARTALGIATKLSDDGAEESDIHSALLKVLSKGGVSHAMFTDVLSHLLPKATLGIHETLREIVDRVAPEELEKTLISDASGETFEHANDTREITFSYVCPYSIKEGKDCDRVILRPSAFKKYVCEWIGDVCDGLVGVSELTSSQFDPISFDGEG